MLTTYSIVEAEYRRMVAPDKVSSSKPTGYGRAVLAVRVAPCLCAVPCYMHCAVSAAELLALLEQVKCKTCGKRLYPDKMKIHRKYFCGDDAVLTAAQALTARKGRTVKVASV